ncbi:Signal recognition particle GTPase [Pseudomonas syringae pv. actinidiae]|uniref:Signal recognition particle GTPase n=1 Tax=Pseudomonas syringae pv. actinidiae TaxID=103796 RepID=A0AAN4TK28_PSESF|nr:Signal recognition particle GTPase [Pseudomonas syringae pv. actinidiae]
MFSLLVIRIRWRFRSWLALGGTRHRHKAQASPGPCRVTPASKTGDYIELIASVQPNEPIPSG